MIVTGASGSFRPLLFGCMLSIVGAAYTAEIETNVELRDLLVSITTASLFLSGIGFVISYQGRKVAEARAQTLVAEHMQRELNHRIKNLFSVVIALIKKRARLAQVATDGDPGAPFDDLVESIAALGRAHGIGSAKMFDEGFDLDHLMHEIMSPYSGHWQPDRPGPIRIGGPSVHLPTRMLTPLALLLHELATNAVKYGALSSQSGRIDLTWNVLRDKEGQQFVSLHWKETARPGIVLPSEQSNQGYGFRIIEAAVKQLDARLERDCRQEGLSLSVILPAIRSTGR
jgi:two-component system CheB/CheR fusion protein